MAKSLIALRLLAVALAMSGALGCSHAPATTATGSPLAGEAEGPPEPSLRLVAQLSHSLVMSVAFSPDGRWVLTGNLDHTATLWDATTGLQLRSFVNSNSVAGVAFSRDGQRLATAAYHTATIRDTHSGQKVRSFEIDSERDGDLTAVAFSPDGQQLLTGSTRTVALWNVGTGERIRVFSGHTDTVSSVAFSPDGSQLLTGSHDGTARLWDAATATEARRFTGHAKWVTSVAFSPDGRQVLTGSSDLTAKLWDAQSGKELHTLSGHTNYVFAVAFSPDGQQALTGSQDQTARLWATDTGNEIRTFSGHTREIRSVAFSPDGREILTGSGDQTAKLWDADTGNDLRTFTGTADPVTSIAFSPDGRRMVIGGKDKTARLWDAESGRQLRSLVGHTDWVTGVAFSGDGRRILTAGDRTAKLWNADTGTQLMAFEGHREAVWAAAISADGRRVLTAASDNTAKLWDAATGKELRSFAHPKSLESVAFSPDGHYAITNDILSVTRVWNLETGAIQWTPPEIIPSIRSALALSPNGHVLATAAFERVYLRDTETGRELLSFAVRTWADSLAFSPDGQRLAMANGTTIEIRDATTGEVRRAFRSGHTNEIAALRFSPDGTRLLTASEDGTARMFDAATGDPLATLVSFVDGSWAVADAAGRFDGSNGGDVEGLHWVVGDTPITLSQLKERYFEPGLLAKVMGFDRSPLNAVESFATPKLFPQVELAPLAPDSGKLVIHLRNQGGGIGRVRVLVNGKEIAADARGPATNPNAADAHLEVSLAGAPVKSGQSNRVEVVASNADGYLSSRGFIQEWRPPGPGEVVPPEIFAIVSGAALYAAPSLRLNFAGKDAADIASAIRISAARLFGAKNVHITLLSDYARAKNAEAPTRDNLRAAFAAAARKARTGDILVVYLAGHGTVAPDGEYWYLTSEAHGTDLSDPEVRKRSGVSSAELTEWIKAVPVIKQVMILDTCAAGAAASKLTDVRALSSDQVRAIARLKDRTGMYVLMGAAANAPSYEANQYAQGLLTYALLQGMRGAALREGQFVDVATLFGHATDLVPKLARSVGGIQQPIVSAPKGASFDIGQLTPDDKPRIPLAAGRPMILRASFQRSEAPFGDSLAFSQRVNAGLRDAADAGARGGGIVFIDGDDLPGALRLTGRYGNDGNRLWVDSYLQQGDNVRAHFKETGSAATPDAVARAVVKKAEEAAAKIGTQ